MGSLQRESLRLYRHCNKFLPICVHINIHAHTHILRYSIARSLTRGVAIYFSRPVRLFRPAKGWRNFTLSSVYSHLSTLHVSSQWLDFVERISKPDRPAFHAAICSWTHTVSRCKCTQPDILSNIEKQFSFLLFPVILFLQSLSIHYWE